MATDNPEKKSEELENPSASEEESASEDLGDSFDALADATDTDSSKDIELARSQADEHLELRASQLGVPEESRIEETHREIIEKELKVEDLREIPAPQLVEMEKERPGTLLFAFTTWGDRHADVTVENFELYNNPAEGTEIKIDFRGNEEAYWLIGAADIIPPQVRKITVKAAGGGERTSDRRVGLGPSAKSGFYDSDGYISVFTGDKIVIGGIDENIREKYFIEEDGKRHWDEEKYRTDHGESDDQYLAETWERTYGAEYTGTTVSDEDALRLRRKTRLSPKQAGDIRQVLAPPERAEWLGYAEQAAAHYETKFGLTQIEPAVIFAIIKYESAFIADIPNQQNSGALGLGQFIPSTWLTFLRENPEWLEKIERERGERLSRKEKLQLRENPEIMIYATTWYASKNARDLGLTKVTPDTAPMIYLAHHDGLQGAQRMLKYKELRAGGMSEEEATRKCNLSKWQKAKGVFRKGKLHYDRPYNYADEHWDSIIGHYGGRIADTSEVYLAQLQSQGGEDDQEAVA